MSLPHPRSPSPSNGEGRALLLLFLLLLIALGAAAIFLLGPGRTPPTGDGDADLPTLAALGPTGTTAASAVFALTTATTPRQTIAASPTLPASPTGTRHAVSLQPSIAPATMSPSTLPASIIVVPTTTTAPPASMPAPPRPISASPTPLPPTPIPASPTLTPSPAPTVTARPSPIPGATPLPDVAFNTPANTGDGLMRLLSVTRPASDRIAELGGSAPALPAGSEWLLVEALVECSGSGNCAPPLSAIQLEGSAGQSFAPVTIPGLEPIFGPDALAVGQVWGYLVFSVPVGESGLALVVARGEGEIRFALN